MAASNVVPLPVKPAAMLVRFERVYGRVACYPANPAAALLAQIAGTKTLSPMVVRLGRELGHEIIVEHQSWKVLEEFLA